MKLISKTLIYYLLVSLPLLVLAGVFSYYVINDELKDGTDDALLKEAENAQQFLKNVEINQPFFLSSDSMSFIQLSSEHKHKKKYFDKSILDKSDDDNEYINYRGIKYYATYNDQTYLITILKPTIEQEELMEGLLSSFEIIIGFLVLAFFIVNWFVSKTLWKPFYNTLSKLNNYDIKQHHAYQFDSSSTKEFNQLNLALTAMTNKLNSDFLQQKEFTENASHEMQTPLAVVKANLSLLMQSQNIKEDEMNQLEAIDNTVKKLTALNKALILLSKIENHQFNENISVSINDKLKSIIKHYEDVWQNKNIAIETEFDNDIIIPCNPTLADVLLTNLLQNAIRHNHKDGSIHISIKGNTLVIANTGEKLSVAEDELFVRFKKNDASKESLGLGLSIVKSISSIYSININYSYTSNKHTFTLIF